MSRKLPLAEIAAVAEGELLALGRACNALTLKIRRVLRRFDQGFADEACLRQILEAAGRMADVFDDFVSERNESEDRIRAKVDEDGLDPMDDLSLVPEQKEGNAEEGEQEDARRPQQEFSGHSDVIPLSEVLDFIGYTRKTGSLRIFGRAETLVVEFESGDVVGAFSDRPPEGTRLGEMLVSRGLVEAGTIEALAAEGRTKGTRIGDLIRGAGLIDAEPLQEALADQIQMLFTRLVGMQDVHFFFRLRRSFSDARTQVRLNAHQLLLEGARQRDNHCARARPGEPAGLGFEGGHR